MNSDNKIFKHCYSLMDFLKKENLHSTSLKNFVFCRNVKIFINHLRTYVFKELIINNSLVKTQRVGRYINTEKLWVKYDFNCKYL